ncbi:dual specificity protein phosphatase family protein [Wenzhouxiangella sp. XN79A]|uniref:dual specificity protein phosphatase family protein n=1 Tax=Wenzhouxiangella sp. XN79A TaxID=2724193 RepID=UPI00144A8766|nr:dual specificity protein phosphatase family protein [Wenzhouxiangella sp. XN79A]NKI36347.1 dual specificity protein phosphatase family protein [Wenzhouxiangella sp. XN79A]
MNAVTVSPLPDSEAFRGWQREGFNRWISLCGVGASDLLDRDETPIEIEGMVFRLADPFSASDPWDGREQLGARDFLEHSTPVLRANLLRAVRALVRSLEQGERVVVFCHLGLSRSPLVAAAGLMVARRLDPLSAWAAVARTNDELRLTRLALAALLWIESTWNQDRGFDNDIS